MGPATVGQAGPCLVEGKAPRLPLSLGGPKCRHARGNQRRRSRRGRHRGPRGGTGPYQSQRLRGRRGGHCARMGPIRTGPGKMPGPGTHKADHLGPLSANQATTTSNGGERTSRDSAEHPRPGRKDNRRPQMPVEQLVVDAPPTDGRVVCHCLSKGTVVRCPSSMWIRRRKPSYNRLVSQHGTRQVRTKNSGCSIEITPSPRPISVTRDPGPSLLPRPDGKCWTAV